MRGGELESCWIESRLCVTVNFCYAIVNKAGCLGSNYCSRGEALIAVNLSGRGGDEHETRRHAFDFTGGNRKKNRARESACNSPVP